MRVDQALVELVLDPGGSNIAARLEPGKLPAFLTPVADGISLGQDDLVPAASVDIASVFWPWEARWSAVAAAQVVLPTPPLPANIYMLPSLQES